MCRSYSAFGLTIASEVPLDELPQSVGTPDVVVRCSRVAGTAPVPERWTVLAERDSVRGWAPGAGAFHVTGGKEVRIDPMPGADDRALRMAVVGPLLGVVLAQRGCFVLHASAVGIGGGVVAITGPSGRGKSTLATALARSGHTFFADDMTVIDFDAGLPVVTPGFARVKLWPEAASALGYDLSRLPLLHPDRTKRSVALSAVPAARLPLVRCYIIEDAHADSIDKGGAGASVLSLVSLTYQARWMHETGAAASNLRHCGDLVRSGVVRRLRRRRAFDALDDVVRLIERDVHGAPVLPTS